MQDPKKLPPETSTVYIVDDDDAVADVLKDLLTSVGYRVATFESASEFLDAYDPDSDGCLLLDMRLPGMSGLRLQDELKALDAALPIIFLSGHADVGTAVKVMRDGAFDFIQKPFHEQALLESVESAVHAGVDAAERRRRRRTAEERLDRLTPRERQVLARMLEGKPNKVMAVELELSQRTIEIHRANVMRKMEAGSIAALVRTCLAVESIG